MQLKRKEREKDVREVSVETNISGGGGQRKAKKERETSSQGREMKAEAFPSSWLVMLPKSRDIKGKAQLQRKKSKRNRKRQGKRGNSVPVGGGALSITWRGKKRV